MSGVTPLPLLVGTGNTIAPIGSDGNGSSKILTMAELLAAAYSVTSDPESAGQPWNNAGVLTFSSGFVNGLLDFSKATHSQYIALFNGDF